MLFSSAGKRRPWGLASAFSAAAIVLAGASALFLASCDSGADAPDDAALSCPELGAKHFGKPVDDGHYQVISPNGGEAFRIGDSLRVLAASGQNDSEAVLELAVFRDGKSTFVAVPGTPRSSIDLRAKCHWNFLIPDSAGASGRKVSLVSDSLKIRVARYGQEGFVYDYSDAFFSILPAAP
jgi:hypothetical protein